MHKFKGIYALIYHISLHFGTRIILVFTNDYKLLYYSIL